MVLWAVTIFSIVFTLVAGFTNFEPDNLKMPKFAFSNVSSIVMSIGMGARIGIYDFSGYQDVCQMGDEVRIIAQKRTVHGYVIVTVQCTCNHIHYCL